VCDNGAPVPATIVTKLFDSAVPSQTGLGIGLYQAARHAERLGYRLRLSCNEPGRVCFTLARKNG
jgi:C4-dicarboxylate-specific signal transduction histidine kinase